MSDPSQAGAARLPGGRLPRAGLIAAAALFAAVAALAIVLLVKSDDAQPRATGAAAKHAGGVPVARSRAVAGLPAGTAAASASRAGRAAGTGGAVGAGGAARPAPATSADGGGGARRASVSEVADPEEASSFPSPATVHHKAASTPSKASEQVVAAGAPSDAEVKHELAQMKAVERSARQQQKRALTPVKGGNSVGGNGTIAIPANVPEVVQRVIAGANAIADFPYVFGGGHGSFVDNAYDCSGSVSYALAAGGLLGAPQTSGELESWGAPGPGRYITVYAAAGHTYMYVDGVLFDTAGRSGPYASRWQVSPTDNSGYVVRHWPGL
jgi:cell wall-associated NlpC family hydrolase